jgi:DNA-binding MarR family transcriptional regulator
MKKLPVMARLGIIFLSWRRHLESGARPYGVTLKQQYLLRRLAESDLRPSQIADMLFCDRPTATVVIDNMRRYGWVSSEPDVIDKRQRVVRLKDAGREKLKELQSRPEEPIDPLACFSKDEREEFDRLLIKLHGYFKACGLYKEKGEENDE